MKLRIVVRAWRSEIDALGITKPVQGESFALISAPFAWMGEPINQSASEDMKGIAGDVPGGVSTGDSSTIEGLLSIQPRLPRIAAPTHIRVAQGVMLSLLVTKVNPNYPAEAMRQHVDGIVVLHINVDKNGSVSKVEPVSGHPLLIPAAIDAVKQWKYKPYLLNQVPVEVETAVLIKSVHSASSTYSVIALEGRTLP